MDDFYDKLTSRTVNEATWNAISSKLLNELVSPDFLKMPHVQEWLTRSKVKDRLIRKARARILHIDPDPEDSAYLIEEYSRISGEASHSANGIIDSVTAILSAGVMAKTKDPTATAITTAGLDEIRNAIHRGFSTISVDDRSTSIVSEAANSQLQLILKRRAVDPERSLKEIQDLAKKVYDNGVPGIGVQTSADIFYWAARLHATKLENLAECNKYLSAAKEKNPKLDVSVPVALAMEARGEISAALQELRDSKTSDGRSVFFGMLMRTNGSIEAIRWFDSQAENRALDFATPLGWYAIILGLFMAERYTDALSRIEDVQVVSDQWPDLKLLFGLLHLAMLFPVEYRRTVLETTFLHPAIKMLEGDDADRLRAKAIPAFDAAEMAFNAIDLPQRAKLARHSVLWLKLTSSDAGVSQAVREEVGRCMEDPERGVELIQLARYFNIPFNKSSLKQFLAQRSRWGGLSNQEVVAEYLISELEMSPTELSAFIEAQKHRLVEVISLETLAVTQVDALVRAGQFVRAKDILFQNKSLINEEDFQRLLALITANEGGDPRRELEIAFDRTRSLIDLHNLSRYLEHIKDWSSLTPLLNKLFELERTIETAVRLAESMRQDRQSGPQRLVAFLSSIDDLVQKSVDLQSEKAWALFNSGRSSEAKEINDKLLLARRGRAELLLDTNLALRMGDWERFPAIVDREWSRRSDFDAEFLVRLAIVASEADSSADRAIELATLAAEKASSNPNTLIAAYALGFQLGKEDKVNPEWLNRALENSNDRGPVWKVDLKTIVEEMLPKHKEKNERLERDFLRGLMPLQMIARSLNIPLSKLLLETPRRNLDVVDGRQRTIIPIVSGNRPLVEPNADWHVAFDLSSLMVLHGFGLLKEAVDHFKRIVLPHDVMLDLLNEKRRTLFHQPSLVERAEEIRELVENGRLRVANDITDVPKWLESEVGRDLADLLVIAKTNEGHVVHPFPIRKLGSFDAKEADIGIYKSNLVSCIQLVRILIDKGHITEAQFKKANEYLAIHDQSKVSDLDRDVLSKPIFIDDLALVYLRSSGLLKHISALNLDIRVHPSTQEEQSAIWRAHRGGADTAASINQLRLTLRDAVDRGKAVFLPPPTGPDSSDEDETTLADIVPGIGSLLQDANSCDALCVDDRFFNQHFSLVDSSGGSTRIICAFDIVRALRNSGILDPISARQIAHNARKSGFVVCPIERGEIDQLIRKAFTNTGRFVETDELRVLRQNLSRALSTGALNQPTDTPFLDSLRLECVIEIRSLWSDETLAVEQVEAAVTWIWQELCPSPIQWASTIRVESSVMSPQGAYVQLLTMLLQPMLLLKDERHIAFIEWAERVLLRPLAVSNSEVLQQIALRMGEGIERIANGFLNSR